MVIVYKQSDAGMFIKVKDTVYTKAIISLPELYLFQIRLLFYPTRKEIT